MASVRYLKLLFKAFFCLALIACSRGLSKNTSRLVISSPQAKASAYTLPANRKACWGVNVTGENIPAQSATQCSPTSGVVAGFKSTGEPITLEVAKGNARKIDLYLYLLPSGSTANCPTMTASIPASQLTSTYLMGTATADFVNDTTEVEITANYPGDANNLAVTAKMPATCTANAANGPPPPFRVGAAAQTATDGTNYKMKVIVGNVIPPGEYTGGSIKLKIK